MVGLDRRGPQTYTTFVDRVERLNETSFLIRHKRLIAVAAAAVLLSLIFFGMASGSNTAEERERKRERIDDNLLDAASAQEDHYVDEYVYTRVLNDLKAHGFEPSPN